MTSQDDRMARRARATWLLGLARALGATLPSPVTELEDELWRDRQLTQKGLAELESTLVDEDLPTFTTLDAVVNSALVALYYVDSPDASGSDGQVEVVVDLLVQFPHSTGYRDATFLSRDVLRDISSAVTSRPALDACARSWAATFRSMPTDSPNLQPERRSR